MEHVRDECAEIDAAAMQQLSSDGVSATSGVNGHVYRKLVAQVELPYELWRSICQVMSASRSAAYWAEVSRRLATARYCRRLEQYEHYLRRMYDAELRREVSIRLEDARERTRRATAEERARVDMKHEDARLQTQDSFPSWRQPPIS